MYDRERHHRRSVRVKGADYSAAGGYFLTICTVERACLFGDVVAGVVRLNGFGGIVVQEWERTAAVRSNVVLDAFVVMPNHVHGVFSSPETTARFCRIGFAQMDRGCCVGTRRHRICQDRGGWAARQWGGMVMNLGSRG